MTIAKCVSYLPNLVTYPVLATWYGVSTKCRYKPESTDRQDSGYVASHQAVFNMAMAWQQTALALVPTAVNAAAFFAGKTVIGLFLAPAAGAAATLSVKFAALAIILGVITVWFHTIKYTFDCSQKSAELAAGGLALGLGVGALMKGPALTGTLFTALGYGLLTNPESYFTARNQKLDGERHWFAKNAGWLADRWIPMKSETQPT